MKNRPGFPSRPVADPCFKLPHSFDVVFDSSDLWSITNNQSSVCIWALNCPPNYVPVGFVGKKDCEEPQIGDAYCVLASLTEEVENWHPIWDQANEHNHGYIKRGSPNATAFNILPMGAFFDFDLNSATQPQLSTRKLAPVGIYAIKRSEGFFWTEKPVLSAQISDVIYDFNNMEKKASPTKMNSAYLENFSHIPQTVSRTISYTDEHSYSFDSGSSVAAGTTVEVGIGIPIPIGPGISSQLNVDSSVTVTATGGYEEGTETVESTTKSITAGMDIGGESKMSVAVVANQYTTQIPYSATLTKKFYDGSMSKQKVLGTFKGVSIDEVKLEYGVIESVAMIANNLLRRKRRSVLPKSLERTRRSTVVTPSGSKYLGCFKDEGAKDLGKDRDGPYPSSIEECLVNCRNKGEKYFGLQWYGACRCSNTYGLFGEGNGCNYKCHKGEGFCGGNNHNSIYEIEYKVTEAPSGTKYLGCYKDKGAEDLGKDRDLSLYPSSIEDCHANCRYRGEKYFGLQWWGACRCSNTYGLFGEGNGCTYQCKKDWLTT